MPGISSASPEAHRRGASAVMIPVKTSQNFIDPQKWRAFCCWGVSANIKALTFRQHFLSCFFPSLFTNTNSLIWPIRMQKRALKWYVTEHFIKRTANHPKTKVVYCNIHTNAPPLHQTAQAIKIFKKIPGKVHDGLCVFEMFKVAASDCTWAGYRWALRRDGDVSNSFL